MSVAADFCVQPPGVAGLIRGVAFDDRGVPRAGRLHPRPIPERTHRRRLSPTIGAADRAEE
jgi:hypothetical protein